MDFFNDLGKKIGDVAGTAANKAKELAEIAKLNSEISGEEKGIDKAYMEIGKYIFEQVKDNGGEGPVAEYIEKILTAQQKIGVLKQRIEMIKEHGLDEDKTL